MLARRHGVTALAHTWISSCVDLTSAVSPTAAKEQTFCKVSSVPVPGKCSAPETALRRPAPQIPPTLVQYQMRADCHHVPDGHPR